MKLFLFNCLCLFCLGTFACEQQAQSAANITDTTVHSAADEVVDEAPTAALADDEAVAEVDSVQDASTAAPKQMT